MEDFNETIKEDTLCPNCGAELNDSDGVFFEEYSATKNCEVCGVSILFIRQLTYDSTNPYCKYAWNETYFRWRNLCKIK